MGAGALSGGRPVTLRYGYISNGFADHSLEAMVAVLAHSGYRGIGITLDHHHLDPFRSPDERIEEIRRALEGAGLAPVVETGARYLLDPFRKHWPALVSRDAAARRRRIDFYRRAVEIAAALGAGTVSLWSGAAEAEAHTRESWASLLGGLEEVLDFAESHRVRVAFEPEPGMFIESLADFDELRRRLPHPALRLTIDLGHLAITEREPLAAHIEAHRAHLINVHVDDVRERRHEHLPLGSGEIRFEPLLGALLEIGYDGLVLVELSRHSAEAPLQAAHSIEFLRAVEARCRGQAPEA